MTDDQEMFIEVKDSIKNELVFLMMAKKHSYLTATNWYHIP
jgi:hypothetical protein